MKMNRNPEKSFREKNGGFVVYLTSPCHRPGNRQPAPLIWSPKLKEETR